MQDFLLLVGLLAVKRKFGSSISAFSTGLGGLVMIEVALSILTPSKEEWSTLSTPYDPFASRTQHSAKHISPIGSKVYGRHLYRMIHMFTIQNYRHLVILRTSGQKDVDNN
ncbi:hypothetical protein H107_07174 [Trichophyton rubrum CBS 202.88]|nr:hypothetical protein H104_06970 [Trichophyton rubrum CBS 289.86]EZG13580.1 hypothetical protein H107_07174 [Trichophyton rubrum CBS 202.88]